MLELKLPATLARKLERAARSAGRTPTALAREAIERELAMQRWWERQIDAGLRDIEAGRTMAAREVIERGDAILARYARRARKSR